MRARKILVVSAIAAAVAISGTAVATFAIAKSHTSHTDPTRVQPAAYAPIGAREKPLVGATATAQAITQITAGLDRGTLTGADLATARAGYPGRWLFTEITCASTQNGAIIPAEWQADLAQGAIAERTATTGDLRDAVSGAQMRVTLANGSTITVLGGAGDVATGQHFATPPNDPAAILYARKTLAAFKLRPVSMRVFHPLGDALSVVATVNDLRTVAGRFDAIQDALLGARARYEGLYLELRTVTGTVVARSSVSLRTGAGRLWVRPGLPVDLGTAHG
jgi:hypothetical protein